LDSSIIQGPFSVAPCQTLISRFATFSSPYKAAAAAAAVYEHLHQAMRRLLWRRLRSAWAAWVASTGRAQWVRAPKPCLPSPPPCSASHWPLSPYFKFRNSDSIGISISLSGSASINFPIQ
jgi:hypothetical protein